MLRIGIVVLAPGEPIARCAARLGYDTRHMRALPLALIAAASVAAQPPAIGIFTNSGDIGAPPLTGSAAFDTSAGGYKITGSGADIWGKSDEFHYLYRQAQGDFVIAATVKFLTPGHAHRKASIMLRRGLDADSPFLHLAIHGDGTPAVQFRNANADNTNTVDFPIEGPGTWKLKLVRRGTAITVWIAKDGAPLRELGHTINQLGSPILAGLAVASHTREAVNTVLFSDVMFEQLPAPKK